MLPVHLLSGEEVAVVPLEEVVRDDSCTVRHLKRYLCCAYGLPPRFQQRILHDGAVLDDETCCFRLASPFSVQLILLPFVEATPEQIDNFLEAARQGESSEVERHLLLPHDPDLIPQRRRARALYQASCDGHAGVVSLLLEAGANKDAPYHHFGNSRTPLLAACEKGHEEVVRLLLDRGADHEAACWDFGTPLTAASFEGHLEVVSLLLDAGVDKDAVDPRGFTALFVASVAGEVKVVKALLAAGAHQNLVHPDKGAFDDSLFAESTTAMIVASALGHLEVVRLLLEARAAVDTASSSGHTAVYEASRRGHGKVVRLLLEAGAEERLFKPPWLEPTREPVGFHRVT